ncbi:MAG TPA: TRAP transporter substrate-binding protein [Candidatus Methylomirabilis sp.]|nr:TRAP transporter substrate-binding protein [Candidatus Methylomirabilis sp.]
MKWISGFLALLALAAGADIAVSMRGAAYAQQPIVIKVATAAEQHLSAGKGYGKFAELVNERAGGKVKVEVYYAGALGAEVTAVRNMLAGTVEMSTISDANLGAFSDALFFMNLPYLFKGTEGLRRVVDESWVRDDINKTLAKSNLRAVMHLDNGGPRHFESNKGPIRVPADATDLKCRTTSSPVEVAIFKGFGTIPTPVNWAEVYTALSQGTVDCEGVQYTWVYSTRHYEVLKYVAEIGYVIGTQNLLVRADYWNKLPKDVQELLTQAGRDAEAWEAKVDADYTHEAREKIIAAGVKVYTPTPDELKRWRDSVVPKVWDQFKDKVSPEFIQRVGKIQGGL